MWNVQTKMQTTVKKETQIPCGICWIHLIVQNRKRERLINFSLCDFEPMRKNSVLQGLSFSLDWAIQAETPVIQLWSIFIDLVDVPPVKEM